MRAGATTGALAALVVALAPPALGGAAEERLGEVYVRASPAEKLARLSVAYADKVLSWSDATTAVEAVVKAALDGGATPRARLELLGKLRADSQALLPALANAGKPEKRRVSPLEPGGPLQLALAFDYVASVGGARPSLEALECLRLVRECTYWGHTSKLVAAVLQGALARDRAFAAADLEGKLGLLRSLTERQVIGDLERHTLELPLVLEDCAASLGAGRSSADVRARLKAWSDRKLVGPATVYTLDAMLARLPGPAAVEKD